LAHPVHRLNVCSSCWCVRHTRYNKFERFLWRLIGRPRLSLDTTAWLSVVRRCRYPPKTQRDCFSQLKSFVCRSTVGLLSSYYFHFCVFHPAFSILRHFHSYISVHPVEGTGKEWKGKGPKPNLSNGFVAF